MKDTMTKQYTLLELAEKLGCYVQPYPGGGAQVFIGRADVVNPELYREFWNLSDAHVTGTLSGPSLHIISNKAPASEPICPVCGPLANKSFMVRNGRSFCLCGQPLSNTAPQPH